MKCPYCGEESTDDLICTNCGSNINSFNKIKESANDIDYTRRIIIKGCLIFFILFICVFTAIILLV